MNKYNRFYKDTLIYLLGSVGSKVVSLLMVSFYTFTLTTSEYGTLDIATTTVSLFLPLFTLCIQDAILSFTIKSEYSPDKVINSGFFLYLIVTGLLLCFGIPYLFLGNNCNIKWVLGLIILEGFNLILQKYSRSINKSTPYAISGIIFTFVMAISNIAFLGFLKLGISGYYLSLCLGYVFSIVYLLFSTSFLEKIKFKALDKTVCKKLLVFSLPLIPDSLMWWVMNALDKYFILFYLGESYNGIYAVACKIPTILTTICTIIIQAWQVSAISESESDDKNVFYSRIFDLILAVGCILISIILIIVRPALTYLISSEYENVWYYVPFLLLGSIFTCLSGFFGANYLASKKTLKVFITSFIGAVANAILNYLFINNFGLNGAAIATCISLSIVCILRCIDSLKFVKIKANFCKILIYCIIIPIEIIILYFTNAILTAIASIVGTIILMIANRDICKSVFVTVKEKISSRKEEQT